MKRLYLVDASNMFFRAFFGIPPLTNDKGMPTNALYGFLSMSLKLIREVKPDYLAYCFDLKEESFRNKIYPEYKANREEMPDLLKPQIPYLKKISTLLGIKNCEMAGFEADDLIGTLCTEGVKNHLEVVIVSGDKDFAQLVRPGVSLYDTMKEVRTDSDGVKAKFGVRPDQIIDYLAMVGDSSDNVPGVRGIGPKGAEKLLAEFHTLDGIYENVDKIKGANQKKLIEGKNSAYMSRKLCTIVTDVPMEIDWEKLKLGAFDRPELQALLKELGFNSFEKKLFGGAPDESGPTNPVTGMKYQTDTAGKSGEGAAKKAPAKSKKSGGGALKPWTEEEWTLEDLKKRIEPYSEIWGILNERGLFFGYQNKVLKVPADEKEIGSVLARKQLRWKGYDVKQVLKSLQLENPLVVWDGMLAAYLVRAELIPPFEEVLEKYCDKKLPDLCGPADLLAAHAELEQVLSARLEEQEAVGVMEKLELPLVPVLADLERQGVKIDQAELERQNKSLVEDIKRLEAAIHKEAGESFNIGSPKQLGNILFEKLKLPAGRKTKTGYSTDSDVLEGLADQHPIAKMLLEYREFTKLKSTYIDALPALIDPKTGRVHTRMNQAATSTGRLSSTNPNLQNIPIRTERGRLVRKAFIAEEGNVLISADYSQIELRILAHITEDKGLTRAFSEDLDIHAATASEVFSIPLKEVTSEHRRIAKAVNFGIAYGQGAFGLSEVLGIPRGEATDIIGRYFQRFPGVKDFMESTIKEGIEKGYVSTLFGRRRYIDELRSNNMNVRKAGERAAINAPIQGTASDLVRLAMIEVHQSLPVPLLLQVHDELLFECPVGEAEELAGEIRAKMEGVYALKVPLKVNVGIGANWDDAH